MKAWLPKDKKMIVLLLLLSKSWIGFIKIKFTSQEDHYVAVRGMFSDQMDSRVTGYRPILDPIEKCTITSHYYQRN